MENSHTQELHKACNDQKEVFIATLVGLHGLTKEKAEAFWLRESTYFTKVVETTNFKDCTEISLKNAFSEIASNFVSIQPGGRAEAFLSTRNSNIGNKENPKWVTVCQLTIQVYGELNMRLRAGHLKHAHNPIVLYEGDTFQPRTNEAGKLIVEYSPKIPRAKDAKIFGCYVHLELEGGINDFKWMLMDDIERLRDFSNRNNCKQWEKDKGVTGKENDLYGKDGKQIDPGFLAAKTLKHAMKTLPKLRLSDGVVIEDDEPVDTSATFDMKTAEESPGVVIPTDEQGAASKTDNGLF